MCPQYRNQPLRRTVYQFYGRWWQTDFQYFIWCIWLFQHLWCKYSVCICTYLFLWKKRFRSPSQLQIRMRKFPYHWSCPWIFICSNVCLICVFQTQNPSGSFFWHNFKICRRCKTDHGYPPWLSTIWNRTFRPLYVPYPKCAGFCIKCFQAP